MRSRVGTLLTLGLCSLLLPAPASAYKKVVVRLVVPPSSPLPRSVHSLAVMDFEGPDGDKFADQVIQGMLNDSELSLNGRVIPKTRFFDIIERSRMNAILREQNLSSSGTIDETTAAQVGKVIGVDAVFIGELSHDASSKRTSEERVSDNRTYHVGCVTNSTRSRFNGRIVAVETGKVLAVFDKGAYSGESKKCGDSQPTPLSDQIEMNNIHLMASVVTELLGSLTLRERELEKISTKEFSDHAKRAAEAAEANNMTQAYVLYKAIHDEDPYCADCAYNLGVIQESVGNYEQALELYETAAKVEPKSKDFATARDEVSFTLQSLIKAISTLELEWPEYVFAVDDEAWKVATAVTLKTAGGKDQRHDVFDALDGNVLFRVPGSIDVQLLEDHGDWVQVRLPDGKTGWLAETALEKGDLKNARKRSSKS